MNEGIELIPNIKLWYMPNRQVKKLRTYLKGKIIDLLTTQNIDKIHPKLIGEIERKVYHQIRKKLQEIMQIKKIEYNKTYYTIQVVDNGTFGIEEDLDDGHTHTNYDIAWLNHQEMIKKEVKNYLNNTWKLPEKRDPVNLW